MKSQHSYIHNPQVTELLSNFDNFIFDIWGVVHNGEQLIPGAKEFIKLLKKEQKKFCFLSNAPRPSETVFKKFQSLGLEIDQALINTSGDFFRSSIAKFSKDKIYLLGEEKNQDLTRGLAFHKAETIYDARYVLCMLFSPSLEEVESFIPYLKLANNADLIMLCPNPDITVYHGGNLVYTPGKFARIYEEIGGKVIYFGKPHKNFFDHVVYKYSFQRSKTLMIGDSLETDVQGAYLSNIQSLLVLTGLHKGEKDLDNQFKSYNMVPNYVVDNLGF